MGLGRKFSIVAVVGAIAASLALPTASARTPAACPTFKPVPPGDSYSEQKERAVKAPVRKVTENHTAAKPLEIEFEQGASLNVTGDAVAEDAKFFNIQIDTRSPRAKLNVKEEWFYPSPHDFDLHLYDYWGTEIAKSDNLGPIPVADPYNTDAGAGYEAIMGIPVKRCEGYTIESFGYITTGASLRLTIWLDK